MKSTINLYIKLTKPTIMMMVAFSGASGYLSLTSWHLFDLTFWVLLLLTMMSGAAANVFNQIIEKDIDARMERTRLKRPLPSGLLSVRQAFIFGMVLTFVSFLGFVYCANIEAALIALATQLFYVFVYTLWLKPTSPYGVVWGGIAGGTSPLIMAAALNQLSHPLPWFLFMFIFIWQPPHFWALALAIKKEYQAVGIPLLPVVYGDARTKLEILIYTLVLLFFSYLPSYYEWTGTLYLVGISIANLYYFLETYYFLGWAQPPYSKRLFWVSILYLFWMLTFIMLDRGMAL